MYSLIFDTINPAKNNNINEDIDFFDISVISFLHSLQFWKYAICAVINEIIPVNNHTHKYTLLNHRLYDNKSVNIKIITINVYIGTFPYRIDSVDSLDDFLVDDFLVDDFLVDSLFLL